MRIVIDITEETYNGIKLGMRNRDDMKEVGEVIENNSVPFEQIKNEIKKKFYERYPKNYMNELELNGSSCVFSYNDVIEIINKI